MGLFEKTYNPDVLTCLANLSNDEVFTPPDVVNAMLDMLPQELFTDPNTTFLDPACKTGVFLREIAKRLIKGLEKKIPDLQTRVDHIFHRQLFGIAITQLTALLSRRGVYCSKFPNSKFSVTQFDSEQGNILFSRINHTWVNGRCAFCGASRAQWDRGEELETHAYQFIHTNTPERIFNMMKFDVIISNPPYQMNNGGGLGAGAIPIYHKFIQTAKKLKPRYIAMIVPARWYSGGLGLDDFRNEMITDKHMKVLVDYLHSEECFSGVEIKGGVCYFLWDREYNGNCTIKTIDSNKVISVATRPLKEADCDVFIRYNESINILHKVQSYKEQSFARLISSTQPFGISTTYQGEKHPTNIKVYGRERKIFYGKESDITKQGEWIDKHKVLISSAYNAGDGLPHQVINKPFYSEPGSCCTATYLVVGPFSSENECENVISYMSTKFFRFMVILKKISQHAPKSVYQFVPLQDFSKPWTDEELYKKYNLTQEEVDFIESMIKPME